MPDTEYGDQIDMAVQQQQVDFDRQEELTRDQFLKVSHQQVAMPLAAYLSLHPELQDIAWYQGVQSKTVFGYSAGAGLSRQSGLN